MRLLFKFPGWSSASSSVVWSSSLVHFVFSSLDEEGQEKKKKEEETEGVALADRKQYAYQLVGTPTKEQVNVVIKGIMSLRIPEKFAVSSGIMVLILSFVLYTFWKVHISGTNPLRKNALLYKAWL